MNVGIETASFEIIIGRLRRTRRIGLLKEHVKRQQRAGLAILHAEALARLAPYRGGIIDIVRVGARVGRPAKPARVEFVDARAALASVARLAVHLPADPLRSSSASSLQPASMHTQRPGSPRKKL